MYEVLMYEDARGYSPVENFINELDQKAARNKSARIQLKQTTFCLDLLQKIGTRELRQACQRGHMGTETWKQQNSLLCLERKHSCYASSFSQNN